MTPTSSAYLALKPFRTSLHSCGHQIAVAVARFGGTLTLRFCLAAAHGAHPPIRLSALRPVHERRRTDNLWKHTCWEAFLARPDEPAYVELNVAPSGDWNVYGFDNYRHGMHELAYPVSPLIEASQTGVWTVELRADMAAPSLRSLLQSPQLSLGVAAIVEYANGSIDYWALHHPCDKPDFHHRDGLVLQLGTS